MSELQAIAEAPPVPGPAAGPGHDWSLRLLGAAELHPGATGPALRLTGPALLLLARLALWPDRSHPREELVELLWPGVAHEVGRNRLRQALAVLRGQLDSAGGAELLQTDRNSIRLIAGALRCDVRDFEDALRRADLPAARALYRGELLPGCYDEWVADERRRLAAWADRLEPAAPAPAAAGPVSDPLPSYWTRPFGVESQRARLAACVQRERLVTLHGPGGSGKTRLAVATAQALRERSGNGHAGAGFERIVFVSLIDCVDARQTLAAVADALRAQGDGPAMRRIVAALGGRHVLLVLDNVEQIDEDAAATLPKLLAALPGLHLLLTSRRLLLLEGETAVVHEGLPLPETGAVPATAGGNPAVALFADRAAAARAGFVLDTDTLPAVIELAHVLGGMPLALELAASRLRTLSAAELLARLTDHGTPMLDLLARPAARASVDARHASLRHVMAWSWRQLDAAQRQMLERLTVFGTSAHAAAIAAAADCTTARAERLLAELHDASLTRTVPGAGKHTRHVLLQPVREFAAERLAPEAACEIRGRLRRWLIATCPKLLSQGPARLAAEMPLVHAAITSAADDGDASAALELALALRDYWDTDALPLPDIAALERALELAAGAHAIDDARHADVHELLAQARVVAGCTEDAVRHAERALALAADAGRRSRALVRWATTMYQAGRFDVDSVPALEEALVLARGSGDIVAQASALRVMAIVRSNLHLDFAGAEALLAQAQALWESAGNSALVRLCLLSRAVMWVWMGRIDDGLAVHHDCERSALASGDWLGLIHVTRQLGRALIRARRPDEAADALRRSLRAAWQRGHAQGVAHALLHLPDALVMSRDRALQQRAARLHGYAAWHWQRTFGRLNPIEAHEGRRTQRLLRRALGAPLAETLRLQGVSMRLEEAVALGLRVGD